MPHIHLETTADLPENADVPEILSALVDCLSGFDTIESKSIKAYHLLRSNWQMGEGAPGGFAHCTVAILAGRELELRKLISDAMFTVLKNSFAMSLENNEVSLTLEVREMDKETYRKL
jgi:5-carboxymethyl-2-hydroxymuconate isomerase